MFNVFRMTWGIRRIVFTAGAILLVGGWGLTGYVDAYQHAAGAAAGERWRDGVQEPSATIRPSTTTGRTVSPRAAAGAAVLRQITPPSSWLYVLGVMVMMSGAGLMALTVPWRGARMTPVESAPEQHYVSPPPPKTPKASKASKAAKADAVQSPSAPAFPGMPPLQAAQDMAAAPMQPPPLQSGGKSGVKPLQYKKGA